ncbi:hypothetical protein TNCV_729381 [Trichonephila clavipes]|nr:hypothetical protein TNCV_729381 [Trichonephila clavipes]
MERGRRRDSAFSQKGGRKSKKPKADLIKRSPRQNGEGGRTPKLETLYRSRAPAGGGEERRKAVGTAERSKSKAVTYHPRTQNKMTQCSAANICC